ncbi:PilZ domain-containing protein [Pseudomonas auratipiscis]|uniref:PilZ domain-containing protein n=1 Tax=Pseudomonas auratipiscis TaxID=3115853 RepID=A0AB35WTK9_9PSED|nr:MULTISPECIES: PilZ domain-containing protein [unclassified Pseudomonas]MEE1866727.1 PilZ domain-containing protein [Pseudomonas sp. 120P]MEE1958623.1 PilZ domain-containing protein [Pseudomonas sp. 119P]
MRGFLPHPDDVPVELSLRPSPSLFRQRLHTISLGGIACNHPRAYRRGMAIEMIIPSLGDSARFSGYVAWCQKQQDGYRVGIAFIDEQALFGARMSEQVCQIQHLYQQHTREQTTPPDLEALAQQWVSLHAGEFSEANLEATYTRQILV